MATPVRSIFSFGNKSGEVGGEVGWAAGSKGRWVSGQLSPCLQGHLGPFPCHLWSCFSLPSSPWRDGKEGPFWTQSKWAEKRWWGGDRHTSDPEMGEESIVGQILSDYPTFMDVHCFLKKNKKKNLPTMVWGTYNCCLREQFVEGRNEAQRKWGACSRSRVTQQNWNLNQTGLRSWLLYPTVSNPNNNLNYSFLHLGYFLFLQNSSECFIL